MKFIVKVKEIWLYEVEADSEEEAAKKALLGEADATGAGDEVLSIERVEEFD